MTLLLRSFPLVTPRTTRPSSLPLLQTLLKYHFPNSLPAEHTRTIVTLSASSSSSSSSSSPETILKPPQQQQPNHTLHWVSRTNFCGQLSTNDVGTRVRLCGWVALHRVHGGLTFFNLRDHTGIVQVATLPDEFPDAHAIINDLRVEYVVVVEGFVRSRPKESINKKMITGSIEVVAERVQLLNAVKTKLPFLVTTADDAKDSVKEEIRLRYRCLDLRRQQMSSNIMLRHRVVKLIRRYLEDVQGFVEIFIFVCHFDPDLFRGCKVRLKPPYFLDLLQKVPGIIWCPQEFSEQSLKYTTVTSQFLERFTQLNVNFKIVNCTMYTGLNVGYGIILVCMALIHFNVLLKPGTFYALPQSPQLFKQMLMVSGFDKYYQIARCFRDEDLRADRQPEFTQLDMELAFTPLEDMLRLNEDLIRKVGFLEIIGVQLPNPFPRLTYAEAMSRYGSDRPDTRFEMHLKDVSDIFAESSFRVFADSLKSGGIIKVLCVHSGAKSYSNTALKKGDIYNEAIKSGAKGLPFLKVLDDGKGRCFLSALNLKMNE
ncbi:unnamed protein product [Dovyalis caffra]|uniref:Aminoacyl-transfer RNA synthetases class-II family profile domain-containing protein n=1 Tax=Dovyalis caffra TaxID=77055 RepID=A0AAV1RC18_9ROSI|nr:unnamed protein product [Dovyalis caffra]